MNLTAEIFKGMNTPDGKPSAETMKRWSDMMEGIMSKKTCDRPDYEAMYNDMCVKCAEHREKIGMLESKNKYLNEQVELVKKLEAESEELRILLREANSQNDILRAQLDTVHLIFGRNH